MAGLLFHPLDLIPGVFIFMKYFFAGRRAASPSSLRARIRFFAVALLAGGFLPAVAVAQSASWNTVSGSPASWGAASNWSPTQVANGQDNTATFATAGLTGPFIVLLDQSRTIGNLVFDNPTNNFSFTIDQNFSGGGPYSLTLQTSSVTPPTIAVNKPGLSAIISAQLLDNGSQGFVKTGLGNLTLTANNGYFGPTVVNGGTLTTDYSAGISNGANILPTANSLTLGGGGSLIVNAGQAQASQSISGLLLNPGAANFTTTSLTGGTFNATLGNITRSNGATLAINTPATGVTVNTTSANSGTGTILGGWATIFTQPASATAGLTNGWATVNGSGNIVPLATYTAAGVWGAGNNTDETTSGTITVGNGSTTNSIRYNTRINGGTTNFVTTLSGGTNTITSGGILMTQGFGGGVTASINGPGSLTSGNGTDLIVTQNNTFSTLTIAAQITGSIGLTTSGPGTTILSGSNNYNGPTYVTGGTLLASTTAALPGFNQSGLVNVTGGGTLSVSAAAWSGANIDTLLANAVFGSGAALAIDVPTANPLTYSSNVSGALGLTKNNAGTLTLTGSSMYTGDTTVNGGTLVAATIANSGSASAVGAGRNLDLGTGGTFQYTGGSATVNRGITLNFNGGAINVATAATNLSLSGLVSGVGGLNKTGPGTLTISGNSTYAGPTVVSAGSLVFSGANSLPAGNDLTIFPGAGATLGSAVSPAIGALSGGGTLNLGSANTLTLGSDSSSGSFQGSITAPSGLSVTKVGSGVQALIGGNAYTGGTNITNGTLLLSPQAPGANPLGTGPVNISNPGVTFAYRQLLPIPTSGYNRDVMWGASEGLTTNPSQQVTIGFDYVNNQIFYPSAAASLAGVGGGLPTNRVINSLVGGGSTFILQPYNANNVLFLTTGQSAPLTLINQGSFKSLNFLVSATNGGAGVPTGVTLNFADGTSTSTSITVLDWFNQTTNVAAQALGRFTFDNETFDTAAGTLGSNNPRMYQAAVTLSAADQLKTLQSITVQNNGTGAQAVGVFGLNGTSVGSPANLTPGNAFNISADTTLEVTGYSSVAFGALTVTGNTVTVNGSSASTLSYTGTTFTGAPTFNVASGVILSLGSITDGGVGYAYTKSGAGTLIITGASNYTGGPITINAGTLDVGTPSALPGYANPGQITLVAGTLAVGFGGAGQWTTAQIGTPTTPGTLLGSVTFPSGSNFGLDVATGTATYTTAGGFTLPTGVGFAKLGGGVLVMNGANTYAGATTVLNGELSTDTLAIGGVASGIGQSSNAATNLVFANGGLVQYTGASVSIDRSFTLNTNTGFGTAIGGGFDVTQAATSLTLTGAGTGAGAFVKAGAGTVILTNTESYTGGTIISAGTLQVGNGGSTGALGTGGITDNATLAFKLSAATTVSQAISGTGGITQNGTAGLTLSVANSYTGPTVVNSSTLLAGNASAFGVGSAVTVASGATLSINGNSVSIGSLTGAGAVNDNTATAATLTVGTNNASTSYGGTIVNGSTGALSLAKVGSGTLTLTGVSNTYTGGTTISAGTLAVNSDLALGSGPVTIGALGTLSYAATTSTAKSFTLGNGTLSVNGGAILTLNGGTLASGFLGGSGTFATGATGAQFAAVTSRPAVTIQSNSGNDQFVNFTNGGLLNVAANLASAVTFNGFTNQGSGSIIVGQNTQLNVSDFQSYGTLTLNPGSFNGTSGGVTQVTNTGGAPLYFNGGSRTFISTVAQVANGNAGFDLHGNDAVVAGGLFVNNGYVYDSVGAGTHRVVADYGSLVKGAGFYQPLPRTINGGTFIAGNSPGHATTGTIVLGGPNDPNGGLSDFTWQINDAGPSASHPSATGTSGPSANAAKQVSGWGTLLAVAGTSPVATNGNMQWDATPADKLTINLATLLAPSDSAGNASASGGYGAAGDMTPGLMTDFDPTQSYSWRLFGYQGSYTGPTDTASLDASTNLDASGFLNPHAGRFDLVLNQSAQEMDLVFTPTAVPEPGTLSLIGLAGLAAGWRLRRKAGKADTNRVSGSSD
jgi:autotransporter-associated beta strand protein